ncbi:MAG: efflux transporter outer membrane subunit [Rudaea sp.]|nr:efflux transporter outer membrane subunit [Rudaea sp.]
MIRCTAPLLLAMLGGCSFAPPYKSPIVDTPDTYKEAGPWQAAAPADRADRGDWWRDYGDTALNELEARVDSANPDLAAAADRYEQARAYVAETRAGLFPQVDAQALATRNRQSDNRPLRSSTQPDEYRDNLVGAQIGYELDLWGRVRNRVAAGQADAQATAADLASVRLSLHAELADDYITLRGLDAQAKLLADTVAAYGEALTLTQNRFKGGVASELDVAHAHTQLDTARAEATDVQAQRALYEHAIASMVGTPASKFSLAPLVVELPVPAIPAGLPSTLLERRPDVAAAERRAAAANAEIGIARAAFFPSITLTASGGYENTGGAGWLTAPNSFWSIGPHALLTLFDAGRRQAEVRRAHAAFDEANEKYRSTTLVAFQQVEDNLALLHLLGEEARDEDAAVVAAQRTLALALDRYRNGAVNYLEVVEAQTAELQAQRTALHLLDRRLEASVGLIRALGGGWGDTESGAPDSAKSAQAMRSGKTD